MKTNILLLLSMCLLACNGQQKNAPTNNQKSDSLVNIKSATTSANNENGGTFESVFIHTKPRLEEQLSQFIRRIFQDSRGSYWYGTNGDGVIRREGDMLSYFNIEQGFAGVAVRAIKEDSQGNVWFATSGGLSKYDPKAALTGQPMFTNYTQEDGLINNDLWCLEITDNGTIWIGSYGGVSVFDPKKAELNNQQVIVDFKLPDSEIDPTRGVSSAQIVHDIMEDRHGKLWFAKNGGVYIYDPKSADHGTSNLTYLTEENGLCNNVVNEILEDKAGNIWFATHHNGICRLNTNSKPINPSSFTHVTKADGVEGMEAWSLFEDSHGNIWFPTEGYGIYRYDGKTYKNFGEQEGLGSKAVQTIYEDRDGRIWAGGHMGLYYLEGSNFMNATKNGPWP